MIISIIMIIYFKRNHKLIALFYRSFILYTIIHAHVILWNPKLKNKYSPFFYFSNTFLFTFWQVTLSFLAIICIYNVRVSTWWKTAPPLHLNLSIICISMYMIKRLLHPFTKLVYNISLYRMKDFFSPLHLN